MQFTIANLTRFHYIRTEIVSERAAAAVNFHPVAGCKRIDPAELEHAFGPVIESAKDSEQIGDDDFVAVTNRLNNFAAARRRH